MTTDTVAPSDRCSTPGRMRGPGLDVTTVSGRDAREVHLTLRPLPGEGPADLARRMAAALREHQATVVRHEVFGSLQAREATVDALARELGGLSWPITYVEGASCAGAPVAGMHVLAVAGAAVETVRLNDRVIGRAFCDRWSRHLLLGDIVQADCSASRPEQARQAFEAIHDGLQAGGMTLAHLARTWFFLEDLLSWYGPFNSVRTDFFRKHAVFDRLVPASTGVSGRNGAGSAVAAGAWAVAPTDGALTVCEIKSPRQCPAGSYGSSFSRAVEIATPEVRRLLVSGTASIAPDGQSVCANDVEAQIDLTMQVIRAIIVSRGMDFPDASRVTAYFKRAEDLPAFEKWRARFDLADWPLVCAQADICRDELLFELEVDTLAPGGRP